MSQVPRGNLYRQADQVSGPKDCPGFVSRVTLRVCKSAVFARLVLRRMGNGLGNNCCRTPSISPEDSSSIRRKILNPNNRTWDSSTC